nr:putative HNHc nuclease [Caldicoprobacter algeriensis]
MPLIAELVIDNEEQARRLQQISPEQRKKIYAILRDMEAYTGESVENLKEQTKQEFIQNSQWEDFSLSDCSRELAADYIEYLINLCFEMGIPLSENPADGFDDVDRYLIMCLQKRICCVCGMPGEIHHVDSIGIGRDRTKIDDSKHRKICLCRKHHTEAHTIGMKAFEEKYHVYGIIWEQ